MFALQLNSWILLNESCIQDRFCSSIFDDMTSNANVHCHIGKCAHFLEQSNKLNNYASFLYPPRKYWMKSFFSCKCDTCYYIIHWILIFSISVAAVTCQQPAVSSAVYMVTFGISNAKLMSIYTQSSYEKLSHISSTTIATLHCNVYPFFYTIFILSFQ